MKKTLFVIIALLAVCNAHGQQVQQQKRSFSQFAFSEFKDAKVLQPFGRFTTAKANIMLKNAALCYLDGDKIKQAYAQRILGVEFDSVKYMKVDTLAMGLVLASNKYNHLVRVTTIDMDRYHAETTGGTNLPFFEISELGMFLEIDGQKHEDEKGYPLKDKYYFIVKGTPVPASESRIKKLISPEKKRDFKDLMANRDWSWSDPESLKMLLKFLPE